MIRVWQPTASDLNKFVELVLGNKFTFEPPLESIFSAILTQEELGKKFHRTVDYSCKVEIFAQVFPYSKLENLLRSINDVFMKNSQIMKILEAQADMFHKTGNNEKTLELYTHALRFTPTKDVTRLIGIYMKRAAVLFRMYKFDLALQDIESALRYKPGALASKLREQKQGIQALIVPKALTKDDMLRAKYRDEVMSRVHREESKPIPILPDFLSVKSDPDKGRYLVTDIDLEPGTTVLVEEPFVSLANGHLKWQTKRCAHCLKETLNPIPCNKCVFCIYCDEKCRSADYMLGHKFECPLLPYAHSMQLSGTQHLALKSVAKAGPVVLKKLFDEPTLMSQLKDDSFANVSPQDSDIYRYIQMLSMASHEQPLTITYNALVAISFANQLRVKTSFFDGIEESKIPGFENFIASLFLRHTQSIPYNTVALTATGIEIPDIEAYFRNVDGRRESQTAVGVYPLVNLLNHACAPTIFRQHLSGGRVAVITNRVLKKGDELSHGYGFSFETTPISERNKEMAKYYHFHCDCIACRENWPLINITDVNNMFRFNCEPCKSRIMDLLSRHQICDIRNELLKSECCTWKSDRGRLNKSEPCNPFSIILDIGIQFVSENRPLEAVPLLIECIKYFQKSPQPSIELIQAQARLGDSCDLISNRVTDPEFIPNETEESEKKEVINSSTADINLLLLRNIVFQFTLKKIVVAACIAIIIYAVIVKCV